MKMLIKVWKKMVAIQRNFCGAGRWEGKRLWIGWMFDGLKSMVVLG
jgi:hypothetical protein